MPGIPYRKKAISLTAISTTGDLKTYPTGVYVVPAGINQQVLASDSSTATGFNWQYVPDWSETSASLTGIKTLQFISGTLLRSVLSGAVEYDGTDLFYTNDSGARNNITARPFLSIYDTGSQTIRNITSSYPITYSNLDAQNDINFIPNDSKIYFNHSFTYSITFSIQFVNVDNNTVHDAYVWLAETGSNVNNTNSIVSIPGAHSGVNGATLMTVNLFKYMISGSYIQLYWGSNSTNVSIQTVAAAASPTRPASPGVILTISRIND